MAKNSSLVLLHIVAFLIGFGGCGGNIDPSRRCKREFKAFIRSYEAYEACVAENTAFPQHFCLKCVHRRSDLVAVFIGLRRVRCLIGGHFNVDFPQV